MSSSSSSSDCSLSDVLAEIKALKEKLTAIVSSIYSVRQQCLAIQDVLQSEEEFTMGVDEDSEDEEPRVHIGSLARAPTGVRMADVGSQDASVGSAGLGASSAGSTPSESQEKVIAPSRGLYRFR